MTTQITSWNFDLSRWLREQCIKSPRDLAFVSGSTVEGFGNAKSDLDLYVIYENEQDKLFKLVHANSFSTGTNYVDMEIYSMQEMLDIAGQINLIDSEDFDVVREIPRNALDAYYRTAIGIPVYNESGFNQLQLKFDKSWAAKIIHVWQGLRCASELDRAKELLIKERYEEAAYAARAAVETGIDSYLATLDEAFTGTKWRYEKLERSLGKDNRIFETAWDLKVPGNRDIEVYLKLVAEFCAQLGLDRFIRDKSSQPDYLYTRNETSKLFRIVDEYFIVQNRAFIYQLDRLGEYVWNMLNGKTTLPEMVRLLQKVTESTEEDTRRRLVRFLQDLGRHRLLEPPFFTTTENASTEPKQLQGIFEGPCLTKLSMSAAEYAITRLHTLSGYVVGYSLNLYDVVGALEARQWGAGFLQSRRLFEMSLDTFLVSEGKVSPDAGRVAATFGEPRFDLIGRVYGKDSPIYQQAIELHHENPVTPTEVEEYATKCKDFVDSVLGLSRFESYNITTLEAWGRHNQCFNDLLALFEFLGIRPFLPIGYGKETVELERTFNEYILPEDRSTEVEPEN